MTIFLFLLFTSIILLIPLLPGVIEIICRSDTLALKIWQHHDNRPDSFALAFAAKSKEAIKRYVSGNQLSVEAYKFIENNNTPLLQEDLRQINLIKGNASMDSYTDALHEIHVSGDLHCGGHNILRAVLVDNNLYLAKNTSVLRWAHAKNIFIKKHSRLSGRITADNQISFDADGQFIYLHANKISFGAISLHETKKTKSMTLSLSELAELHQSSYDGISSRLIIRGDCVVPENKSITGDLIVYGKLHVMNGARIDGNIKAHDHIRLFSNSIVNGAVTTNTDTYINSAVFVKGPLVAEKKLSIKSNSIIGTPIHKTSVTANIIKIKTSSVIHGTLRAKKVAVYKA